MRQPSWLQMVKRTFRLQPSLLLPQCRALPTEAEEEGVAEEALEDEEIVVIRVKIKTEAVVKVELEVLGLQEEGGPT